MLKHFLRSLSLSFILILIGLLSHSEPNWVTANTPHNEHMGFVFIGAPEYRVSTTRFDGATNAGAGWDRWPLYWHWVNEGSYVGSHTGGLHDYDTLVADNLAHGLTPMVILLGTPDMRASSGSSQVTPPRVEDKGYMLAFAEGRATTQADGFSMATTPPNDLYAPIFADGSDTPTINKAVNQANSWATFVANTVDRYRPGGTLAQANGWAAGVGVRHWEIWNEPDLSQFWNGSAADYYRLLQVAYQTIKSKDPQATVILGGLAFYEKPGWLAQVLAQTGGNSAYAYFDALGFHYYWSIYQTEHWLTQNKNLLQSYNLGHIPIWITESGVPVTNDYPATQYNVPLNSPWRGTVEEQAAYIIQNSALAFYNGVSQYLHFMLHDDCGNAMPDAFGVRQNFSPHVCNPAQGHERPSYLAFQLAAQQFQNLTPLRREKGNGTDHLIFQRTTDNRQVSVVWATDGSPQTITIAATGSGAAVYWVETINSGNGFVGQLHQQTITAQNGSYTLNLPAATNQNSAIPNDPNYYIGGRPLIIVQDLKPADTTPPASTITPLPTTTTETNFTVQWSGKDNSSGIASYTVWVSVDNAPLQPWLTETGATSAVYSGQGGHRYGFAVQAHDNAGNSEAIPTMPQTVVEVIQVTPNTLSGQVVNYRGEPVAEAVVLVRGNGLFKTRFTNATGAWSVANLPPGDYNLYTAAANYGAWATPRQIRFQNGTHLLLTLQHPTNLVYAPDFESRYTATHWQYPDGSVNFEAPAFDGSDAAQLGQLQNSGQTLPCDRQQSSQYTTLQQTVNLVDTSQPSLSFLYQIKTNQTTAPKASLAVLVEANGNQTTLSPEDGYWQATPWQVAHLDLSAWAGQRVDIRFQTTNCGVDTFIVSLDRVSVGRN